MSTSNGVRAPLISALRIDRTGLRPLPATKATAGVVLPLVAGVALGDPAAGATAAFGAISVGVAVITAGPRTPTGTMLAASAGMSAATFVGAVSGLVPAVHLLVLAAAGFTAGLLVAAGRGATQVGVNATIALLVFGRITALPGPAAVHAAWVLAGGLCQTTVALVARSPRPLRAQRTALAAAYGALAQAASAGPVPIGVADAAVTARDTIEPWLQAGDRPQAATLRGLADELDRIRHELHALHFQRGQLPAGGDDQRRVDQALRQTGGALHEISAALADGRQASGTEPAATELLQIADQLTREPGTAQPGATQPGTAQPGAADAAPASPGARFCGARVAALAGQLRAVTTMAAGLAGARRITVPVAAANAADAIIVLPGGMLSVLRQVRAATSPSSPAFRHGVRLAVVIPVATEISRFLPWQRGYWLPVAALIVLKPDFSATVSRGVARTIGTGVGVLAAAAIVAGLHPSGPALILLIGACTWLGYTVFAASYALYAVFLTALVILLVSAAAASALPAVANRGFDTLIGGGLAILAYLVWPTWEARTLQVATANRFEALRLYLEAVLSAYLDPDQLDPAALARHAATTRRAQSSVTASLDRARGEPTRARPDVVHYAGVLSAGRRVVAGTHALASHLRDARRQVAVPVAADLVSQVGIAMSALVLAIRSGRPSGGLPDLRHAHRHLTLATATGQTPADRRGAILAALLDPVIDAIDTAGDLLGAPPRSPAQDPEPVSSAVMPDNDETSQIPATGTATVHILQDGYAREDEAGDRVGSTVTLITDGAVAVVVDPGMVASRDALLAALAAHDLAPEAVTDVVFSHHHPDHTINAALFPAARIHDFWAIYDGDLWITRDAEGAELSPSIRLMSTPGHTDQDISTVASTPDGVHVCTHAWWGASGPAEDPFSPDQAVLARSRQRILDVASVIIPGHGPAFAPGPDTPR